MVGKDSGKTGKVMQVLPASTRRGEPSRGGPDDQQVVVEGLNILKKHIKPTKRNEKGQRLEFSAPLAISKVQLVCPKCNKITRVGFKVLTDGKKQRICRKCKEIL